MLELGTRRWAMWGAAALCAAAVSVAAVTQAYASSGPTSPTYTPPLPPQHAMLRAAPFVAATNAHCGQTLTASLTLNGDLDCSSSGGGLVIAGTAAVTLNLNGHTIVGNGQGYGIEVVGTSDIVDNGTVTGYAYGVVSTGSKATITKITAFSNYWFGIEAYGPANKVTSNSVISNTVDGIDVGSAGGTYSGNHVSSNGDGMIVSTASATVSGNFVDSNTNYGIFIYPNEGGTITGNSANYNGLDGIYNLSAVVDGGNTAHGNDIQTGTKQEQCLGVACS